MPALIEDWSDAARKAAAEARKRRGRLSVPGEHPAIALKREAEEALARADYSGRSRAWAGMWSELRKADPQFESENRATEKLSAERDALVERMRRAQVVEPKDFEGQFEDVRRAMPKEAARLDAIDRQRRNGPDYRAALRRLGLKEDLREDWSEAARAAALEARRKHAGPKEMRAAFSDLGFDTSELLDNQLEHMRKGLLDHVDGKERDRPVRTPAELEKRMQTVPHLHRGRRWDFNARNMGENHQARGMVAVETLRDPGYDPENPPVNPKKALTGMKRGDVREHGGVKVERKYAGFRVHHPSGQGFTEPSLDKAIATARRKGWLKENWSPEARAAAAAARARNRHLRPGDKIGARPSGGSEGMFRLVKQDDFGVHIEDDQGERHRIRHERTWHIPGVTPTAESRDAPRPGGPREHAAKLAASGKTKAYIDRALAKKFPHLSPGQVSVVSGQALRAKTKENEMSLNESLAAPEHPPLKKKDTNPRSNWVERAGGLPHAIDSVARALVAKRGWDQSRAIATAVSFAKRGCATGLAFGGRAKLGEKARAQLCAAVAEWEAKKAKSHVTEGVAAKALGGAELTALYEVAVEELLAAPALDEADDVERERAAALLAIVDASAGPLRPADGFAVLWAALGEAELSAKARNALPDSAFVFSKDRRYPIHDEAHARNALARSSGKPEEGRVKAAVYAKYPKLKEELREAQPRKTRTKTFTNRFHGTDKRSRTNRDLLDELKACGHAGGGEPMRESELRETWSEAARKAALEARRRGKGDVAKGLAALGDKELTSAFRAFQHHRDALTVRAANEGRLAPPEKREMHALSVVAANELKRRRGEKVRPVSKGVARVLAGGRAKEEELSEDWSPEARAKALEARRKKHHGIVSRLSPGQSRELAPGLVVSRGKPGDGGAEFTVHGPGGSTGHRDVESVAQKTQHAATPDRRHHAGIMRRYPDPRAGQTEGVAILPTGKKLNPHSNEGEFSDHGGKVFVFHTDTGGHRAVTGGWDANVGDTADFTHDQTRRSLGRYSRLVGIRHEDGRVEGHVPNKKLPHAVLK